MTDPNNPLVDIKDLDIVSTVEVDNTDTNGRPVYHALYASQLYGTFFGVFGQFLLEPIPPGGTDDTRKVKSLHLRVLNLQGVLNIGFSTYDPTFDEVTNDDGTKKLVINMGVRGASRIQEKTLTFKDKLPLQLKKGKRLRIELGRLLFPMTGVEVGPGTNPSQQLNTPNQEDPYFDSEFHYRNGVDHSYQAGRIGMSTKPDKIPGDKLELFWPAGKCVPANLYLLYTGQ